MLHSQTDQNPILCVIWFLQKTFMRPAADPLPTMKIWRAHLAFLNLCRLIGGGTFAERYDRDRRMAGFVQNREGKMWAWRLHFPERGYIGCSDAAACEVRILATFDREGAKPALLKLGTAPCVLWWYFCVDISFGYRNAFQAIASLIRYCRYCKAFLEALNFGSFEFW